jgi:hypothetical protein
MERWESERLYKGRNPSSWETPPPTNLQPPEPRFRLPMDPISIPPPTPSLLSLTLPKYISRMDTHHYVRLLSTRLWTKIVGSCRCR